MFFLKKKLLAMRPRMLAALALDHAEIPTDWETPSGSFRTVKKGTDRHKRRAQRASITALAGRVRDARYRTARLPLELIDQVLEEEDGAAEKTVFDGMSAYEVELIVRCELGMEGNVDTSKQRRRFAPLVPTTQAVEHALWLFVQAIDEFCDDPTDIANVKIEYARFLQVFTADVNLATSALESAKKDMPSVEGEFEVFSRMRGLQQKRQSQSLGAERDLNLIALVEYGKRITTALDEHKTALLNQHRIFKCLKHIHHTLDADDDTAAERLGVYIEAMTASTRKANRLYARLLLTHPSAPNLGSIFNRFALDVLNDEALASRYSDDDAGSAGASSAGGGSAWGGQSAISGGGMSKATRGGAVHSLRVFVPRTRAKELSFLDTQFQCGTLLLLGIAGAMFVTTRMVLSATSADVSFLGTAGKMQTLVVSAGYWARELSLVGTNSTATASMLTDMRELKALVQLVHSQGSQQPDVTGRWDDPNVATRIYAGNNTWYTRDLNLYDCANRLVAHLHWIAESTTLTTDYAHNPSWRFAMDNAAPVMLPAFEDLLQRLEQATRVHITLYSRVQAGLVVVLAATLFVLGYFVFRRALARVSVIKRAVNEVALALQPGDIERLKERAQLGLDFVEHAKTLVNADDSDDQSQLEGGAGAGAKTLPSPTRRRFPKHMLSPTRVRSPAVGTLSKPESPSAAPQALVRPRPPAAPSLGETKRRKAPQLHHTLLSAASTASTLPAEHDSLEIERLRLRMSSTGGCSFDSTGDDVPAQPTIKNATKPASRKARRGRIVTFAGVGDEDTPFSPTHARSVDIDSVSSSPRDSTVAQEETDTASTPVLPPVPAADSVFCSASASASASADANASASASASAGAVAFGSLDDERTPSGPTHVPMDQRLVSSSPCTTDAHDAQSSRSPRTVACTATCHMMSSDAAAATSSESASQFTCPRVHLPILDEDDTASTSASGSNKVNTVLPPLGSDPQAAMHRMSSSGFGRGPPLDEETTPLVRAATGEANRSARCVTSSSEGDAVTWNAAASRTPSTTTTTSTVLAGAAETKCEEVATQASGGAGHCLMRSSSSLASPVAHAATHGAEADSVPLLGHFDSSQNLLEIAGAGAKAEGDGGTQTESDGLPTTDEGAATTHDGLSSRTVIRRADGVSVPVPDVEHIFHAVPGALCCADATGTLVAVNDHFCRMLGYPTSVSLGSSLSLFVQPESLKLQQKLVRKLILTGSVHGVDAEVQDGRGQQIDIVCQSGATIPVLLNMARIQHGPKFYVLLDIQDLRNHLSSQPEDDDVRALWVAAACFTV